MFRINFQKLWVVYLIASYTVFTIPEPVFAQNSPYIRNNGTSSAEPTGGGASDEGGGSEGGAEPIVSGSSPISENVAAAGEEENIVAEASNNNNNRFRGGPMPPRKQQNGGPGRPPRRHPPPRKISPISPPPQKPLMLKPGSLNKPKPVPKYKHKEHLRDSHERFRPSPQLGPLRGQSNEESSEGPSRYRNPPNVATSVSKEEFFPSGQSASAEYSKEKSRPPPPPPPPPSLRDSNQGPGPSPSPSTLEDHPAPWPKPAKPVILSYYYDSHDGHDLKTLKRDHHLRRSKECDGLDNFVYDLDVIAFLLGVIAAGFGLYSDVIPFFNDGVKITYNNDLMGDGEDFPHDYWPKYDAQIDAARASADAGAGALNQIVLGSAIPVTQQTTAPKHPPSFFKRRSGSGRTISIGTKEDNIRDVLSVTGEFIGLLGLGISFIALFPHLVEKFFYSLDWWFGKRGLWKQYLYTYKCEVHPYPQPGWGRR